MVTYTAPEVLTIIAAIGVLVTGVGAAIVNIIVALRTGRQLEENTAITAEVSAKADVITGHVNSAATAAAAKIDALQQELQALRAHLSENKETAALLAQATATRTRSVEAAVPTAAAAATIAVADAAASLHQIDQNTAAIKETVAVAVEKGRP